MRRGPILDNEEAQARVVHARWLGIAGGDQDERRSVDRRGLLRATKKRLVSNGGTSTVRRNGAARTSATTGPAV